MPMNLLKRIIACALCTMLLFSLAACGPYIDQEFVNANSHFTPKPTESETEDITPSETTPNETEPEESKPAFKPGGFTLAEGTETTEPDINPIDDATETTPDTTDTEAPVTSKPPSGTSIGNVKVSSGLRAALQSLGGTSTTRVTAFQPNSSPDGGQTIIHIKNNGASATQYTYTYYEQSDKYAAASEGMATDARDDALRLILRGQNETTPVENPDMMSIVLFDGYVLWR